MTQIGLLQILGLEDSTLIGSLIFWIPYIIIILFAQRIQMWFTLNSISRSLKKIQIMKEKSRKEAIEFISEISQSKENLNDEIDQFLEYFLIQPVSLDPAGIVQKLEHILNVKDNRMKEEIKQLIPNATDIQTSNMANIIELASALNYFYKAIRHYYLLGKKTMSAVMIIQLQMILPTLIEESNALMKAIEAFKRSQPIGDGVGAMIVGKMMIGKEKKTISKETIIAESNYKGRLLYLIKAEGPGGNVGQPGDALVHLIDGMGNKVNAIIMIDAALKLEGEKTGEIAEGVGAAIGGIGVERFKIEEIASKNNIPLYAILIKQSFVDAISIMKKEIAETTDTTIEMINRTIEDKTIEGDQVAIIGVGNTVGIAQ